MAESKASGFQKQQTTLQQLSWNEITEPGAYVEVATGALYRVPQEALLKGASPLIKIESSGSSPYVQLSKNPFVLALEARMMCAEHNIQPGF
ncbi:MAG: hypothetical protein HYS35_09285 [Betaproteobacteria bacterium]|nr:hypothetical protein [Betaproteobacteria bacterium]